MRKSIPDLRPAGWESISDLPRIQQSYREKVLMVIAPVMRICATSNGEQRDQVWILVVQGLSQKQRQLMQQYFELWIGKDSNCRQPRGGNEIVWKVLNAQSKCGNTGYVLRKNSQRFVKSCSVKVWKDSAGIRLATYTLKQGYYMTVTSDKRNHQSN